MESSLIPLPPRQIEIGDAAQFVGTTPEAIGGYHENGLLPEPERGSDGHRRYGYEDMIRLLWIHKMVDAGIAMDDIREVLADAAPAGVDSGRETAVVQRMRTLEGRMGLLSDLVAGRLKGLPEGSLRQTDLDNLLVMERFFGPLGAAVNAGRYIVLATHPGLREESDRVEAAEDALDDTVAADDPRVAQAAAERHAFELKLDAAINNSGQAQSDNALFDSWDALHPAGAEIADGAGGQDAGSGEKCVSLIEAIGMMPYDYSPARLRCMELTGELAANELPAS
ncbi:MerR family transcriptional regulator [Arthrobacter jiangjiafuii]|uniref:MerR family transcriptional regulator n=1 Tax=Arthrobacter jiangjiafuii TaxID=2817475 RepID=A0A975R2E6_9MICC|nr:MerR family transcriptional regulator [Arthrobacter jiangjiafuii]MBP3042918.1 MerR family transcriptional regulator [Arthrobacter jiangjiafuii]QWC11449.1 MerR family transcriptional regulator [Arthrobacter jiangjiafuii]